MVCRIKKIYKQFALVLGMGTFLACSLYTLPVYYHLQDSVFMALNVRQWDYTNLPKLTTKKKPNIWKIVPNEDRIHAQLMFKPKIDGSLPPKRILLQNGVYAWDQQPGNHTFVQQECPIQNCELVDYARDGELYDARMFKENDLNVMSVPEYKSQTPRHGDQIWIVFALESPQASPEYEGLENMINWTATYRPDSTIVTPYEKWLPYDNFTGLTNERPTKNYAKGKSKLAAMFVSNCPTSNERMKYVHALQKYMDVDVYGSCGSLTCDRGGDKCFQMLKNDYKFYLAFENANCRHYITEKMFLNALQYDIVPVVMGAHPDDYKRAAPPGSYIHVEDFPSPKELAQHLLKLHNNHDDYNMYFRWKRTGRFINTKYWCRVCSMLWDPNRPRLSVPSLQNWWRGNNTCIDSRRWKDIT